MTRLRRGRVPAAHLRRVAHPHLLSPPGSVTGTLGVFGPMRMPYARTIPTVRFMADLLSGLVSETMVGDDND